MDRSFLIGPRTSLRDSEIFKESPSEALGEKRRLKPAGLLPVDDISGSKKNRRCAERITRATPMALAEPKENHPVRSTSQSALQKVIRYPSLKAIADLLPEGVATSKGILSIAERAFDSAVPYFLAKQKSSVPPLYRDSSTLYDYLFLQQNTFYDEGSDNHEVWKKHVEDQEFLLFTGQNAEPFSIGSIYDMFAKGLNEFLVGLFLMAANPRPDDYGIEQKVLISFLYTINFLPKTLIPAHVDILKDLTSQEISAALTTLTVALASSEASPMLGQILDQGVLVNERDRRNHFVPLTSAIVNNAKTNVDLLIKRGASLDVDKEYLREDSVLTDENEQLVLWARNAVQG